MAVTIPGGTFTATYSITMADVYTLLAGTTRTHTAGVAITANVATGSTTIDIEGTLVDTASTQRAFDATLTGGGQILIGAAGSIQSLNADTIRVRAPNSRVDLTNLGQILSTSTTTVAQNGTNIGTGFALTYNAILGASGATATDYTSGGVITNGSTNNTTALIQSNSGDAIRMGSHMTLINYGVIKGNGPVNDSNNNNGFNSNPNDDAAAIYDTSRGVRFNQNNGTAGKIENYGTIEAAQHGVDVGVANVTNLVINNYAGATILGHNGSGVGADTTGVAANTVTVENFGTIRGEYAPTLDRVGFTTVDGDADGVDVDGSATIINHANATIAGSGANGVLNGQGAGGFDSNGRANRSEGISIGGGLVTNDGTISGANFGITVNNDSNTDNSRSGVLATTITNNATGTIIGQSGFAIRLENKTGTSAADNDTIINYGTITGNGTIPDPAGVILRQDGLADPGANGTLDGMTYTTAANAGNARFISGDGSAIQTGEGSDTLSNYGSIVGNNGRTINLEGGDDTLNLFTGQSITGRIDGGAGSDTINLQGMGTGTLSNTINVETLSVQGGSWTVSDTQAYSSGVTVSGGTLFVDGSLATSSTNVTAGTLGGTGTTGAVAIQTGGTFAAGHAGLGIINTGALTLASGATFAEEIGGTTAGTGYDQTKVTGAVDLGGASLSLQLVGNFLPGMGQTYTIITNDGADPVTGTFANYLEGATVTTGGVSFTISYRGGDGNDVTLSTPASSSGGGSGGSGGSTSPSSGPDMLTAAAAGDTLAGGDGDDTISGNDGNDLLYGNQGNDSITTGTGANTVFGGMGDDQIAGGANNDLLFGNEGADTINAGDGNNTIVGGQDSTDGADLITAGAGNDLLLGNGGNDSIAAGSGNDSVVGGFGDDILYGNIGNDILLGNQGNDLIFGGFGDDTIYGGQGADTITGNEGNDLLYGNEGADRYVFGTNSGTDIVQGFASSDGDRLDLMGQTYVVTQDAQGSAILTLSGGGMVTLAGIAANQLNGAFFA